MSKPFDPETAENAVHIEQQFAVKAVHHADTYWKLIQSIPPRQMKLTKQDDVILDHLKSVFPDIKGSDILNEDEMKSAEGKKKWRDFMMKYEKTVQSQRILDNFLMDQVEDYNFGTLLRTNAKAEYDEKGTIFVPRMQFVAIELLRNREGDNDWIYEEAQSEKKRKAETYSGVD